MRRKIDEHQKPDVLTICRESEIVSTFFGGLRSTHSLPATKCDTYYTVLFLSDERAAMTPNENVLDYRRHYGLPNTEALLSQHAKGYRAEVGRSGPAHVRDRLPPDSLLRTRMGEISYGDDRLWQQKKIKTDTMASFSRASATIQLCLFWSLRRVCLKVILTTFGRNP